MDKVSLVYAKYRRRYIISVVLILSPLTALLLPDLSSLWALVSAISVIPLGLAGCWYQIRLLEQRDGELKEELAIQAMEKALEEPQDPTNTYVQVISEYAIYLQQYRIEVQRQREQAAKQLTLARKYVAQVRRSWRMK